MRRTIPIDPHMATALAARRRAAGLTQNALALELGISEALVSKIETARTPCPAQVRASIDAAIERLSGARTGVVS